MSDEPIMDARRKRLLYRSRRRGMQETDLLLGRFAEQHLADLDDRQLLTFDNLLDESDTDLFDWISGRVAPPEALDHDVMKMIQEFKNKNQLID